MNKIMLIIAEMNDTAALHTKVSNKHLLITRLKNWHFIRQKHVRKKLQSREAKNGERRMKVKFHRFFMVKTPR